MIKQLQVSSDIRSTGQLRWFGEISIKSCKNKQKQNKAIHQLQVLNVEKHCKITSSIYENVTGEM